MLSFDSLHRLMHLEVRCARKGSFVFGLSERVRYDVNWPTVGSRIGRRDSLQLRGVQTSPSKSSCMLACRSRIDAANSTAVQDGGLQIHIANESKVLDVCSRWVG